MCHSLRSQDQISLKCLSVSAPAGVRDMFEQAKECALHYLHRRNDAVGHVIVAAGRRQPTNANRPLNQPAGRDGRFEMNDGVILVVPQTDPTLDPALLRPGRLTDKSPCLIDILGREHILKVHMRKVPVIPDVDARVIAREHQDFPVRISPIL